ncbi:MAG TPA: hypothetical protein VHE57_13330 [Mycobacteriales bacterium]|nr:hypothetical protein [Mycobacteriales bacterium]
MHGQGLKASRQGAEDTPVTRRGLIRTTWVGVLGVVTWLAALHAYHKTFPWLSDWVVIQVGARTLVHYHLTNLYSGPRLHVYVDNPDIQIGPPVLWSVAAFEWLNDQALYKLFSVVSAVIGLVGVLSAFAAGGWVRPDRSNALRLRTALALATVVTTALVANEADRWKHIDDVMALTLALLAAYLIARQRAWWLIGLLLGTGIAAKPWALILAPILLALPRRDLARTTLVTICVAAAWWAPFVIAAPDTLQALGHYEIRPTNGSVLYLVGLHGPVQRWLRPVQFFLGLGVGAFVCRRRDWLAAPLAALAARVLTDPFAYGYYGLGPLLFAAMYDAGGRGWRGYPTFTAGTVAIEFVLPYYLNAHQSLLAGSKAAWAIAMLAVLLARKPQRPGPDPEPRTADASPDRPPPEATSAAR